MFVDRRAFWIALVLIYSYWNLKSLDGFFGLQLGFDDDILRNNVTETLDSVQQRAVAVVDILSVGSNTRLHYLDTQEQTFGTHESVRNFFRVTENDDTELNCQSDLSDADVEKIVHYCGRRPKPYPLLNHFMRLYASKQYLRAKSSAVGWMCAQKRPIDGLLIISRRYRTNNESLPDYLFLIDDDTYFNMNRVIPYIQKVYSPDQAVAVAGCLVRMRTYNFSFPCGGWGTILTRSALENLIRPIYCESNNSREQQQQQCSRLQENLIGERLFFQEGMSVLELMHKYATGQPYTNFSNWRPGGYCLHSDTTLAYFINYYNITASAHHTMVDVGIQQRGDVVVLPQDPILAYNGSHRYLGRQRPGQRQHRKECLHRNDESCDADSHICHYVSAEHIQFLFDSASRSAA